MSSSPAPEFDSLLRDFIAAVARTVAATSAPSQPDDAVEELVFTVSPIDSRSLFGKDGPLPASESAIEALPRVTVTEEEDCAICLTEYGAGGEATEMPCKHRYHSGCIMKWLGIHGSCPVCRYEMPVDEAEKRRREGGDGWRVMITIMSRTPVGESGRDYSESINGDGSSTQDMERDGDMDHHSMDLDNID